MDDIHSIFNTNAVFVKYLISPIGDMYGLWSIISIHGGSTIFRMIREHFGNCRLITTSQTQ